MTTAPDDLYTALVSSGRLAELRRLTYRCTVARCLLLDVVETPLGVVLHQKRFKNSSEVNQRRSNAAGRAKNTLDGDRRWKPRTYFLQQSALSWPDDAAGGQSLQCDHVGVLADGGDLILRSVDFAADWQARHTEVRVRPDGTRYALD